MQQYLSVIDSPPPLFYVFVAGSKGGVCEAENESVRFGTTEPHVKYPVPAAGQAGVGSAPGACARARQQPATAVP